MANSKHTSLPARTVNPIDGDVLPPVTAQDPAAEKKAERERTSDRFEDVARDFIDRQYRRRGLASSGEVEAAVLSYLVRPWAGRRIGTITKADVLRVIDGIFDAGHGRQANKTLAYTRQIFTWAIGRGLVERDPTAGIENPHTERSRDRILSDDELVAVWHAAGEMGWPWCPWPEQRRALEKWARYLLRLTGAGETAKVIKLA